MKNAPLVPGARRVSAKRRGPRTPTCCRPPIHTCAGWVGVRFCAGPSPCSPPPRSGSFLRIVRGTQYSYSYSYSYSCS